MGPVACALTHGWDSSFPEFYHWHMWFNNLRIKRNIHRT